MNSANSDTHYMKRCLELARHGLGKVAPNPMVGSVIVCDGKIIGEGYHEKYGHHHAEVNAINAVIEKELLQKSTLYVNLEPCSHFGKTPPCADKIVEMKIPRVVIGTVDPNSLVAGRGIERLKKNEVHVTLGLLEEACYRLNRRFFIFHAKKRPYIILKWAQSADGFIDIERDENTERQPFWISNPTSKMMAHKWRAEEQGILVGNRTVINDNSNLNTREWPGESPVRILIDPQLKVSPDSEIYNQSVQTIIYNNQNDFEDKKNLFIKLEDNAALDQILSNLYEKQIQSIIIEGGSNTLQRFIDSNQWDEARVIQGENRIENGLKAPFLNQPVAENISVLNDSFNIYYNKD